MLMKTGLVALGAASAMLAACTPPAPSAMAAVSDKVYTVTPSTMKVKAEIVTGEVTDMKVTERVEEGTGRVAVPAKLTGKLSLKNISADQTMRLVGGKIRYIDMRGKPIALEDNRTEPSIQVSSQSYGASDRLDPGQVSNHMLDAELPAAALKTKNLKEETLTFAVSIGGQ